MADVAGSKVIPQDELDSSCLEIAINEVLGMLKLFLLLCCDTFVRTLSERTHG